MYWYTIPDSSFGNQYVSSVNGPPNPRSASSYGAMVRGLRQLNDQGETKKPIWMFVEILSGSPGEEFVRYIDPDELKGAVMSSIINEARGIVWFNNVASETHSVGNVLREAQVKGVSFVGYEQVVAMGEINNLVHGLAPVINTQSYEWNFGSGLDTMLKAHNGYAYIFAMTDDGSTGSRTLVLPDGISGDTAEVIGENRTITINNGTLTDNFQNEYTYHIYKIRL